MLENLSNVDAFYQQLPAQSLSVRDLMEREQAFEPVPADWHVLVTDIENSTGAIGRGLHEAVNLIGAGSIIAVLNIARARDIDLPFFFGGDGATILVPPSILQESVAALLTHRKNTRANYNMNLRLGQFSIGELARQGQSVRLAKWRYDETGLVTPVVLGNALIHAEAMIKREPARQKVDGGGRLNLDGMQCKWDRIKAPEDREEIVSLLILVRHPDGHARVYRQVLEKLDEIYGPKPSRNPVNLSGLNLLATIDKLREEMKVKLGGVRLPALMREWVLTFLAKYIYFPFTRRGANYLRRLVELSETLVLDGSMSTVISGNARQRQALTDFLDGMETDGEILFGYFVSPESVMSCYVRDSMDDHIHFIDGSEGGYTRAAGMLKEKLRQMASS